MPSMNHMYNIKKGQQLGKWKLSKFIGEGGNGEVWQATEYNDASKIVAIKLLKRINNEGYTRFKDEVKILTEKKDITGLLQIIDYDLPENLKDKTPWYSMPIATPLMKDIEGKLPEQIVDVIISVSKTLTELHGRGISHRDIKPDNMLVINNQIFLSDFGLVHYPAKKHITLMRKDLGPRWTIAPEMKRNPDTADGKLADIYSLAKTLWILLTKEEKGFEGQYNTGTSVEIKHFVSSIYHGTIDSLLHQSTDNNPKKRPSIEEFRDELIKWKELNNNFEKRSKSEWVDIQKRLFPSAIPIRVIWENLDAIITVLTIVSGYEQAGHTLFPNGGGFDLEAAKLSFEAGCIELHFDGSTYIVKPNLLIFESFQDHSDWTYLRLETEGLELIGKYKNYRCNEGLTELEPCVYTNYECYEFDDFNGERLPASARQVVRLAKGSFIICLRTGVYNRIPGTYDGRHDKMSADEFRKYIEGMIISSEVNKGKSITKMNYDGTQFKEPIFKKSTKVRKGSRILDSAEIKLIKKVIALFKEAEKEYDELCKKVGLRNDIIDFFDEQTIDAMRKIESAPRPKSVAFKTYLETLSDDELALIEAVMYGGRDASTARGRAYPLEEMLEQFSKDSRESRLHAITGKGSLHVYLTAGIKAYK